MMHKPGENAKTIFRIDLFSEQFDTFKDIENCLRDLADDLHSGSHDIRNDKGEVVGTYGIMRLIQ